MSKSNNYLCTPENSGEQKGEYSPFFHTPSTEEIKEMFLNFQNSFSYSDDDIIRKFSTFFHEEARNRFFESAQKNAQKRVGLAESIAGLTMELAKGTYRLASMTAPPMKKETNLLASSASRALRISDFLHNIDTNILSEIYKSLSFEKERDIFFQIQKDLTIIEEVEKHLRISPFNISERRQLLLIYPPNIIAEHISKVLKSHQHVRQFLEKALVDSAKEAKQNHYEKYNNILHNFSVHLHDTARMLEVAAKDLSPKVNGT